MNDRVTLPKVPTLRYGGRLWLIGSGHLLEVGTFLEALGRVGIDAVRALHRVRDRERDECLLAFCQRAGGEDRRVVFEELLAQFGRALGDRAECFEMVGSVVMIRQVDLLKGPF